MPLPGGPHQAGNPALISAVIGCLVDDVNRVFHKEHGHIAGTSGRGESIYEILVSHGEVYLTLLELPDDAGSG